MHLLSALVRACHPAPTVAVTGAITALAVTAGRGSGSVWVCLAVLTGQLSVGWSNDYLDRDRDRRAGRIDKPLVGAALRDRMVLIFAFSALAACVPLSLASGWRAAAAHLGGVASAWGYNWFLKRTIVSFLPYAVGFGLLPAFVTLGLPSHPWPAWWVMAAAALVGVGAHFANVLPDIVDDLAEGVRGLPQRLGPVPSRLMSAVLLVGAGVILVVAPPGPASAIEFAGLTAIVLIVVCGVALRGWRSRAAFLVAILAGVLDTALLIVHGGGIT